MNAQEKKFYIHKKTGVVKRPAKKIFTLKKWQINWWENVCTGAYSLCLFKKKELLKSGYKSSNLQIV